jgi:ribose transport system permease protein/putative xylitol transport system permease protein
VGLQFYAQYVVTWIIIILAVWLDIAAKRGRLTRRPVARVSTKRT